jgi:hypothetical protein
MLSERSSDVKFEIGHVLFIDIVGYTKLLTSEQHAVEQLNEVVRNWDEFKRAGAWDIRAYLLGQSFPGWNWGQRNGQFPDNIRAFVKEDAGMISALIFCKAPFFQADGSELLYLLLSAGEGIRCVFLQRFDILCEYDMVPDRTLVTFFFSLPVRVCGATPGSP